MVGKALELLLFSPSLHGRHCRENSDPVRAGKESQPLAESAHCTEHCAPDTLGDQGRCEGCTNEDSSGHVIMPKREKFGEEGSGHGDICWE